MNELKTHLDTSQDSPRDNSTILMSITKFTGTAGLSRKLVHNAPPFPRVCTLKIANLVFVELAFPADDNLPHLIIKVAPFLLRAITIGTLAL